MANEILYKEELQPTLNTIIGVTPKTLPAVLNKGDIVKYGNYLYKYKGVNGVRKELVDESSFKKVGLRYREKGYKVDIVDTMENLYKWMYEVGLNGDRQKSGWVESESRRDTYDIKMITESIGGFCIYRSSSSSSSSSAFISLQNFINGITGGSKDYNSFFYFPIKFGNRILNNSEELKILFDKRVEFYKDYYNGIHLKKIKNSDKLFEELEILEKYYNNEIHTLKVGKTNFFEIRKKNLQTYAINDRVNESKNIKYISKEKIGGIFSFGVFQTRDEKFKPFSKGNKNFVTSSRSYSEGSFENTEYISEMRVIPEGFELPLENSELRFWLPYFNDMERSDYSGESARTLNRDFNKYGIYFKLEEDGNYVYRFKSVFTDRNQHEEWGMKGPWGARYAYYLNATDVRGDGDTYCRWQSKKVDTEVTFTIEGGKLININIKFGEETRDTNRLKNEFINTGYSYEDGYLFIKVFYAIWSYDDAGDWNEWQFAHIIPPFSLEFKGENEFESKPIFKPPVDEWED